MNFPTYDCFLDKTVSFLRGETHDFLQTKDKSKKFIVASIATVVVLASVSQFNIPYFPDYSKLKISNLSKYNYSFCIAAMIACPAGEEYFFRRIIQDQLLIKSSDKTLKKLVKNPSQKTKYIVDISTRILLASTLFSFMHLSNVYALNFNSEQVNKQMLYSLALGIIFGMINEKYGTISSFAAHSIWNISVLTTA